MNLRQLEQEWFDWYSVSVYPMQELPEYLLHKLRQEQERLQLADELKQKRNHLSDHPDSDAE